MPKTGYFSTAVKFDFKVRGVSLQEAADATNKSKTQLLRELKGKTKRGYVPPETLAALAQQELISETTVDTWWKELRKELRFKAQKKKPRFKRSH